MSYSPTVYCASIVTPSAFARSRRRCGAATPALAPPSPPSRSVIAAFARVRVEVLDQPRRRVRVEMIDERFLADVDLLALSGTSEPE